MAFGFREPYQILGVLVFICSLRSFQLTESPVDAQMIQDSQRFSMDLIASLERTLSAKVKPSMNPKDPARNIIA